MGKFSVNSLLFRLVLIFAAILSLVIFSMLNAIYTANAIRGQAAAINESGKLRMRSYRIANELSLDYWDSRQHWQNMVSMIKGFERHLLSSRLLDVIPKEETSPQRQAYNQIKEQWYKKIHPLFDLYLEGIVPPALSITEGAISNLRKQYLLYIDEFVAKIDRLVLLLEKDTEIKVQHLYRYQLITLMLTLVLVAIALTVTHRYLMSPLRALLQASEQISKADFSCRIEHTGNDELGKLGKAFNYMSAELETLYASLEQRVEKKTRILARSNSSLQFLLKTARLLSKGSMPQAHFLEILQDLEKVLQLGKGATICLSNESSSQAVIVATTEQSDEFYNTFCLSSACRQCLTSASEDEETSCFCVHHGKVILAPVKDLAKQYGVLALRNNKQDELKAWQKELIESVAQQLAASINRARIESELHKIALHEERSIIARELHDSLAQSLTYMKIQISRLVVATEQADSNVKKILHELKEGLNQSYKELRQLLDTFRFKPETDEFIHSLDQLINSVSKQSGLAIELDNQIAFFDFTPNEEVHILQIIREALANVVQHSGASQVKVSLKYKKNVVSVSVDDNGKGIGKELEKPNHYGIISMRERTRELGGSLNFINKDSGGLCIELLFKPNNIMMPLTV